MKTIKKENPVSSQSVFSFMCVCPWPGGCTSCACGSCGGAASIAYSIYNSFYVSQDIIPVGGTAATL